MKYRLGLDMGTNSIGWAAVKLDESGNPCGVLDMGVRIFPDGRNPKDQSSLAVQRRVPRGQRRRRDRYLHRREDLMDALVLCGLMPPDEVSRKSLEGTDPYRLRARALDHRLTPYELGRAIFHLNQRRGFKSNRKSDAKADAKESKVKLERISTLGKLMKDTDARTLGEYLARRHAAGQPVRARAETGFDTDRSMYDAEFDAVRSAQQPRHALTTGQWEQLKDIIFFQRPLRPVPPGPCLLELDESGKPLPRAPKAVPLAQEFRMVQEVNNLRLREGFGPERTLSDEERSRALAHLRSGKDINLEKPQRDLRIPADTTFNLSRGGRKTIKRDETAFLAKDDFFGATWSSMTVEGRSKIIHTMIDVDDPAKITQIARDQWGLSAANAKNLASVNLPEGYVRLSEKAIASILPLMRDEGLSYADAAAAAYGHHSDFRPGSALPELPYYGQVMPLEVVNANPLAAADDLPAVHGRIPNPTVHIGLNQIRRIINRLIEVHGKPESITVELARDLKTSPDEKREIERRQKEGRERNERLVKDIESAEKEVSAESLRKLRLWEEQGPKLARLCPYTGTVLSFDMVMSAQTEIDHILPWSKTLADSPANQVVCIAKANREKGNRSPFEAFGHNPAGYSYDSIMERASNLPDNKKWRFLSDAMDRFKNEREFLDRQLNETQWLSRIAREYLAHLYNEKDEHSRRVDATNGKLTALLRRGWGLNSILDKTSKQAAPVQPAAGQGGQPDQDSQDDAHESKRRDDHRHHAVDAFVIALTTPATVQRVSKAAATTGENGLRALAGKEELKPWPGFRREDLRPFLERMVVSHKPDHGTPGQKDKTTGALHEATAYGFPGGRGDAEPDRKPVIRNAAVVVRKKLDNPNFKKKELDNVRDPDLSAALKELWDRVALETGKPDGNAGEFAKQAWDPGIKLGGRTLKVRSVRVTQDNARVVVIKDRAGRPYKAYEPGGNEFADIWQLPPWPYRLPTGQTKQRGIKPGERRWEAAVVSTFEANQPGFNPAKTRPHPAAKHIARLHINDMCALGPKGERQLFRVRKIDARGLIHIDPHNEANTAARTSKSKDELRKQGFSKLKDITKSADALRTEGFRKVSVDEIGRLMDPGPAHDLSGPRP